MTAVVGRGVRIEVADTFAAAKTISAITLANPGVATSTAHGLADASVGYLSGITGMVQLEGMAIRVNNPLTNTFELEAVDTTLFPAFSGTCQFTPVSTWQTVGIATGYGIGGGEADKLDNTTLLDDIKQELNGYLAAQSVSINVNAETFNSASMTKIEGAARTNTALLFRVTLKDGSVRVFRGEPSLPGEDVQRGQIGTGAFSVTVKGFVVKTPA
jgi:hypothetical protein